MDNLNYLVIELEKIQFVAGEAFVVRRVAASFYDENDALDYCFTLNERGLICRVFQIKPLSYE